MNNIKIIASIIFMILSVNVLAQNTQDTVKSEKKESIIKIAPMRMVFGRFTYRTFAVGGGYEFINNNRQSTHFGAYYIFPNTLAYPYSS